MTTEDLKSKLESLEKQKATLVERLKLLNAAVNQCEGAIGFCKGLIAEVSVPAPETGSESGS